MSFYLGRNKDSNNELRKLKEIPVPEIDSDSLLCQLSKSPRGDTMELAVSRVIEGLCYGSVMVEMFAEVQVFAAHTPVKSFPASYNMY